MKDFFGNEIENVGEIANFGFPLQVNRLELLVDSTFICRSLIEALDNITLLIQSNRATHAVMLNVIPIRVTLVSSAQMNLLPNGEGAKNALTPNFAGDILPLIPCNDREEQA